MSPRTAVAASILVVALLAGGFLVYLGQGTPAASTSSSSSSTSTLTTTSSTGTGYSTGSVQGLRLGLSVNSSWMGSGVGVTIAAEEYNTLASENNVTKGDAWALDGLTLGACGTGVYPIGVALYHGTVTAANASSVQAIQVFPPTPCPLLIRYVAGYLFQPSSDLAAVLPGADGTPILMAGNLTASQEYSGGSSTGTPLPPGSYTAVAGDEWGALVFDQFTVTTPGGSGTGTLDASFEIGPIQPVCRANATVGPAPTAYQTVGAVVYPPAGDPAVFSIAWTSDGCSVSGTLVEPFAPGSYSLNLTGCTFQGCSTSLPRSFVIVAGQSTALSVSIDTGIR